MKRIIIVMTLTILTIMGLFFTNQMLLLAKSSATASDAMITANQLYETGQYLQSAQAYQQLVDQGYVDSSLYYNLGNAYFKAGDFGRAVLNFRRAEQLAPRDADQRGILETLTELTQEWITLDELALAALTTWLVFALLVIVVTSTTKGGLLREILQYALVVTTLVLVLGIVGLASRMYVERVQPEAVVVASEVSVTSGPGQQYLTEFALHSGTEAKVIETRENWVRLAVSDGELQGWVPSSSVEVVVGPIS
jgi:tetratricopeptide (TPR) repeat protein